jgi:CRP/FNR family transcriptional regulator, cyclic AMP receptor protein
MDQIVPRLLCLNLFLKGAGGQPETKPDRRRSVHTLAEIAGTTQSRITHFMSKFREMGLVEYNAELTMRTELLADIVLHD